MKRSVAILAVVVAASIFAHSDINNDGNVDLRDYSVMQTEFTGPEISPTREVVSFHNDINIDIPF